MRAGVIHVPVAHLKGVTRVIVRLQAPPLAAWSANRTLSSASRARHLDVSSAGSRAYLAQLARLQAAAVAQVKAAIPSAQVQEHYRVILDGFALSLPVRKLPALLRLNVVNKVYPSLGYFATMDRGPAVIDASQLESATGDAGQGMKIGVVDTGVDPTSPFLAPAGFSYPDGFPKGDTKLTTPKVIVARVFPGPVRDASSDKPFDNTEPHGTHVSGIAAGDAGTTAPAGPDHPVTSGLSGVAPKAWIGNYRVFTVPTPLGHEANTPEIVAAFESAVSDGMNVINFSGGGPQTDPANDAMYEAIHNTVLAGVVPVIAAGNDREDFGFGTAGSPGSAPDAVTVAAVSNSHVFAPALAVQGGPPSLGAVPVQGSGVKFPAGWSTLDQTVADAGSVVGTDGKAVDPYLCGTPTAPNTSAGTLPPGSLKGKIVLLLRGNCTFISKAERAVRAGAIGMIFVDNRQGEANSIPIALPVPAGMISDLDGKNLRAYMAENSGQASIRMSSTIQEIQTGRSGVITSFSSAGPTAFGYDLKPDIAAPGLDVLSSTPPRTTGSTFSVFAGTSMATPHIAGAAAVLLERHPSWAPWQVKSALMSSAAAAWADTARTQEASVLLEGAGLADVAAADDPKIFTAPQSLSFERIDVTTGGQVKSMLVLASDAGDGAGTWSVSVSPQSQTNGVELDVPQQISIAPGGDTAIPVVVRVAANATTGQNSGFVVLSGSGVTRRIPYSFLVERPALAAMTAVKLQKFQTGSTSTGVSHVSTYCCPSAPFGPAPTFSGPSMNEDGAEHLYWTDDRPAGRQLRRVHPRREPRLADRSVRARLEGRERRPGLRGHPDRRERPDVRRQSRHRRGRRPVPAPAEVLCRGRLARRSLHRQAAQGLVPPERVDQRRDAADRAPADEARQRRSPADRRAGRRRRSRRRSAVARLQLQGCADRSVGLRPAQRHRRVRPAEPGAEADGRDDQVADRRLRLPGGQEHRHGRFEPLSEHGLPLDQHQGRERPGGHLGRAAGERVRAQERPARRRRRLDDQGPAGRVPRRRPADRHRQVGAGRDLLGWLVDCQAREGRAPPDGDGRRSLRPQGRRSRAAPRLQVAVVSGASSGIGAELVRELRARGWLTVGLSRRESGADEHETCDVADRDATETAAARVLSRHPRIDLLVCNAGIGARGGFLTAPPERIEGTIRTNYLGAVWTVLAFLPGLDRGSHIVNVVSVAGTVAGGPYSASKHAQLAFSRSLAVDLSPRGIAVHTVNPGFVETPGFPQRGRFGPFARKLIVEPPLVVERLLDAVERGRSEIVVPRWYRPAAWVQAVLPGTVARTRARVQARRR